MFYKDKYIKQETMSSHYIFINSKDRLFGTNTDFTVSLGDYDTQAGATLALSLEGAIIPNMKYPINNQSLVFYENSVATPITANLVDGFYDDADFATMLETQLNAVGSNTYTVSFDENTYRITITANLLNTIQILFDSSSTGLNQILGFQSGTSADQTVLTGDYPIDLSGTPYLDIELEGLSNNNMITSFISNSIIARVQLTVPFGGIQYYQSQESDDYSTVDGRYIHRMRIRLLDKNGEVWEIPETFDVNLTLRVSYLLS